MRKHASQHIYVKIGMSKAYVLWDSESTMSGITPSFAHLAGIILWPLKEPIILQLGTVGSQLTVKFGTVIDMDFTGFNMSTYVEVANFDYYDVIIGVPFMWRHKVKLNFETGMVRIGDTEMNAHIITLRDTDRHLRYSSAKVAHRDN